MSLSQWPLKSNLLRDLSTKGHHAYSLPDRKVASAPAPKNPRGDALD